MAVYFEKETTESLNLIVSASLPGNMGNQTERSERQFASRIAIQAQGRGADPQAPRLSLTKTTQLIGFGYLPDAH